MKRENFRNKIILCLKKLAFGNPSNIIKLFFYEDKNLQRYINKLDFFNITKIKKSKNGDLEIKFVDKLKALEKLQELTNGCDLNEEDDKLYDIIEKSVKVYEEHNNDRKQ